MDIFSERTEKSEFKMLIAPTIRRQNCSHQEGDMLCAKEGRKHL